MTTQVTTIETADGPATINHELLQEYRKEAFEHLASEAEAKGNFKDVVEAVADATKLSKKIVSKYFKGSYKASLKSNQEEAEVLSKLDEIVKA